MSKTDELQAAVANDATVEQSAITLLQGLSAQLTAALSSATPDQAVQEVIDNLNANASNLAAAVSANTPADPNAA